MGLLPDPIESLVSNTVGKVADKLISYLPLSAEDKANLAMKAKELDLQQETIELQTQLQQLAINAEEAKSNNLFVAGGRPAFLWIGVAAFGWNFVVQPILIFFVLLIAPDWAGLKMLPQLDWTTIGAIVLPLLGISYHQTQENMAAGFTSAMIIPGHNTIQKKAS